jgi:hypothetical protein
VGKRIWGETGLDRGTGGPAAGLGLECDQQSGGSRAEVDEAATGKAVREMRKLILRAVHPGHL